MRRLFVVAALLSLTACSVFNKPDPGRLDGGPLDAGMPDVGDVGTDTNPDAWTCPGGELHERSCGNGLDDDCDGVPDCGDADCITSGAAECCQGPTALSTETFDARWSERWNAPAGIIGAIDPDGAFSRAGASPGISMVQRSCLNVDQGLQLRFDISHARTCPTDCDGHLDVVIGPSATYAASLVDDLAIRGSLEGDSLVLEVVQGGTVRMRSPAYGTNVANVVVDLAPGVADGVPAIVANVVVNGRDELAQNLFVTNRDVFGTSTCHGLHLGVQGFGNGVALDNVEVGQRNCSNPARFTQLSPALDAVTTTASSPDRMTGWGRGGIGDPALFQYHSTADEDFYELLFDAAPVDRASQAIGHPTFSVGAVVTTTTGFELPAACDRWRPQSTGTACMPDTVSPLITSSRVMRDPTLYADGTASTVSSFRVAWVGETGSSRTNTQLFTGLMNAGTGALTPGTPVAIPSDPCPSIRNPLLLPLMGSTRGEWLLFYVCDVFPPEVHAATMDAALTAATRVSDFVLGPTELHAPGGVTDIAGVVYDYGRAPNHLYTYRLWLTVQPTTATTAVAFVEGVLREGESRPDLQPFPGNPVLLPTSPAFLDGDCGAGCQIHGITATRVNGAPTQVRLLVERWVDGGSGLTYSLVPMQQVFPAD